MLEIRAQSKKNKTKKNSQKNSLVARLAGRAGPGADDGDSSHNDRRAFRDRTFVVFVL